MYRETSFEGQFLTPQLALQILTLRQNIYSCHWLPGDMFPARGPSSLRVNTLKRYNLVEIFDTHLTSGSKPSKAHWAKEARRILYEDEGLDFIRDACTYSKVVDLEKVITPGHMIWWWELSMDPYLIRQCEVMVMLVCGESKLNSLSPEATL